MQLDLLDGSEVNFLIAFLAGGVTFFASCLLPLVPTYLAYLSGVALSEDNKDQNKKWLIFKTGLFFVIGFITTFILLGLAASQFGSLINTYRNLIEKIAGVLFIILGLFMLGLFKNNFLAKERKFDLHNKFKKYRLLHAVLTGIIFGFGWTPCIGPVLAVILFWAAQTGSALKGALLLVTYGLGLGMPFLIISLGFEKIIPWIKKRQHLSQVATVISGLIVFIAGILLIKGSFQQLSLFILDFFNLNNLSI